MFGGTERPSGFVFHTEGILSLARNRDVSEGGAQSAAYRLFQPAWQDLKQGTPPRSQ